jgi:hypothetical protein
MRELICHFQDYMSALSAGEKRGILHRADAEVLRELKPSHFDKPDILSIDREPYRQLVSDVRRVFAGNAPAALTALVEAGPDAAAAQGLSGSSREALLLARERVEQSSREIPAWALDPENWFLIGTNEAPITIQSRISSAFPCILFENGPIECAAAGDLDVRLANIEDILQATGVYQLWAKGNMGQDGVVCVLDTGASSALVGLSGVSANAVDGLQSEDRDGHGTAVIEMIRALSPRVTIESMCVTQSYSGGQIWNLVAGLTSLYTVSQRVVNLSLGVTPEWVATLGPQGLGFRETMSNVLRSLAARGHFPVAAAGNDGAGTLRWPAASAESLAVGAHNAAFERSAFSNHRSDALNMVLAPGGEVRQIDGKIIGFGRYGEGLTRDIYGTSFSTAVASALASLLSAYEWFASMQVPSKISLFKNHCRRNSEGYSILNVADVGAVWPI